MRGFSPMKWLCKAVTWIWASAKAEMTGLISFSKSTRSPHHQGRISHVLPSGPSTKSQGSWHRLRIDCHLDVTPRKAENQRSLLHHSGTAQNALQVPKVGCLS